MLSLSTKRSLAFSTMMKQQQVAWARDYVDGDTIQPKLPTHLRTRNEEWNRNQRVKDSESRAAGANNMLNELNERTAADDTASPNSTTTQHHVLTQQINQQVRHRTQPSNPTVQPPATAQSIQQHSLMGFPWSNIQTGMPMFPIPTNHYSLIQNSRPQPMVMGGFYLGTYEQSEDVNAAPCEKARPCRTSEGGI